MNPQCIKTKNARCWNSRPPNEAGSMASEYARFHRHSLSTPFLQSFSITCNKKKFKIKHGKTHPRSIHYIHTTLAMAANFRAESSPLFPAGSLVVVDLTEVLPSLGSLWKTACRSVGRFVKVGQFVGRWFIKVGEFADFGQFLKIAENEGITRFWGN